MSPRWFSPWGLEYKAELNSARYCIATSFDYSALCNIIDW